MHRGFEQAHRGMGPIAGPKFQPVDATKVPRFSGIATFKRTCRVDPTDELDIGMVGVPVDLGLNDRSAGSAGRGSPCKMVDPHGAPVDGR